MLALWIDTTNTNEKNGLREGDFNLKAATNHHFNHHFIGHARDQLSSLWRTKVKVIKYSPC